MQTETIDNTENEPSESMGLILWYQNVESLRADLKASSLKKKPLQWMRRTFPDWKRDDFEGAAIWHRNEATQAGNLWTIIHRAACLARFNREPDCFRDFKISGIGRHEFFAAHRATLRQCATLQSEHSEIATLFQSAAKNCYRWKVSQ